MTQSSLKRSCVITTNSSAQFSVHCIQHAIIFMNIIIRAVHYMHMAHNIFVYLILWNGTSAEH